MLGAKGSGCDFPSGADVDIVLGTQNIDRLAEILGETTRRRIVQSQPYNEDGLGEVVGSRRHVGISASDSRRALL